MRAHLSNSLHGILDYVAQPAVMLCAAPALLHHLGVASYGLWLMASAAVSAGSIVSSSFGDAVIQRIATLRLQTGTLPIRRVIANVLAINLILGSMLAGVLYLMAGWIATRMGHVDPILRTTSLWSLRIGAFLILIKSVESVYISAQRAYERYAPAVRIGVITRVLITLCAVMLALHGFGVIALMFATAILSIAAVLAQWIALRRHLGAGLLRPSLDRETVSQLASVGGFTWLQAVGGVLFTQADRLILGTTVGAASVAYYSVAIQICQPIHGITAAALHWMFPHLAARISISSAKQLLRPMLAGFAASLICASTLAALALALGPRVIALWLGLTFAMQTAPLLPIVALGFGLLAMNISAHNTLMACGRMRLVALLNLAGGCLMLIVMRPLVHAHGVMGAANARLCYGPITLLMYIPLIRLLRTSKHAVCPVVLAMEEA